MTWPDRLSLAKPAPPLHAAHTSWVGVLGRTVTRETDGPMSTGPGERITVETMTPRDGIHTAHMNRLGPLAWFPSALYDGLTWTAFPRLRWMLNSEVRGHLVTSNITRHWHMYLFDAFMVHTKVTDTGLFCDRGGIGACFNRLCIERGCTHGIGAVLEDGTPTFETNCSGLSGVESVANLSQSCFEAKRVAGDFDDMTSCEVWNCSCQQFSNRFRTSPGQFGQAASSFFAQRWWMLHKCATSPRHAVIYPAVDPAAPRPRMLASFTKCGNIPWLGEYPPTAAHCATMVRAQHASSNCSDRYFMWAEDHNCKCAPAGADCSDGGKDRIRATTASLFSLTEVEA